MRLYTNIKQCNLGMIKSKVGWQVFYNLRMTQEEVDLYMTYQLGERMLAEYTDPQGKPGYVIASQAVQTQGGIVFHSLVPANNLKVALIEGCARLCEYMRQIEAVRAGRYEETIVFDLHPTNVPAPAGDAPPVAAEI